MKPYWQTWSTLETILRAHGIPLGIGPELSSLVGIWYQETMTFWEKDHEARLSKVREEVTHLRGQRPAQIQSLPSGASPETYAHELSRVSPVEWAQAWTMLQQHRIHIDVLETLVQILESPGFTLDPTPFQNSGELVWLVTSGNQSASLVLIPMEACEPGGEFTPTSILQCHPVSTEILAERDPLRDPPQLHPLFGSRREPPFQPGSSPYPNVIPVDSWRLLKDQEFAWKYLCLGASRTQDLVYWVNPARSEETSSVAY